ncbi:hypothetical protein L226DRAFT_523534 [Lentinus tigrinus ALCF2SS1-7]|uniref:uncharacterized protein n=1 Tax=Lentinus tigrinus ALCF2SS1-7 TaxID=1328758 RepID=UPI001166315F|nr:hypothetical protein L226DRAFT_523534 [Lentinus tigrinus ALCF2SS1-7]
MPKGLSKLAPSRRDGPLKQPQWKCNSCGKILKIQVCGNPAKANYEHLFVVCHSRGKNGAPLHAQFFRFCQDPLSDSDSEDSEWEGSPPTGQGGADSCQVPNPSSAIRTPPNSSSATGGTPSTSMTPMRCVFSCCTGRAAKQCPHSMCRSHCSMVMEACCELRSLKEQLASTSAGSSSLGSPSRSAVAAICKVTADSFCRSSEDISKASSLPPSQPQVPGPSDDS